MSVTQPGPVRCSGRRSGRAARLARGVVVAAGAAVLVACGGGGGGGITSAPAEITADNAERITAEVLRSIDIAATLGPVSTDATIGPGGSGGGGAQAQRLAGSSRRSIQRATTLEAFGPDTFDCDVSGTVRISGDIADFDTLTAGDTINATFTSCNDGVGDVLSGGLRLVVVQAVVDDIDLGLFDVTFDATFTNLRITTDGETFAGDGTARLAIDTRQSPEEATISGDQFRFTAGSDEYRLTDFAVTLLVNLPGQPGASSVTATGTLDSNDIDGRVDFVTVLPFVTDGTEYPADGTLDILGADDARIRVNVVDAVNLELAVDTNGDDLTDVTIPTTWLELEALAD
jgi:hypothetical protein